MHSWLAQGSSELAGMMDVITASAPNLPGVKVLGKSSQVVVLEVALENFNDTVTWLADHEVSSFDLGHMCACKTTANEQMGVSVSPGSGAS